ncbi:hypothetical protein MMC11_004278 [Xylographa trunciseda]|nr:hypothetical protein [Xylographa trunciseda]
MVGISISPALTGLFDSFAISVIIALSLFAFSAMYLSIFVGGKICSLKKADLDLGVSKNDSQHGSACAWLSMISIAQRIRSCVDMIFSPLQLFYTKPIAIFPGLSLLLYNAVQSYIFAAIMVHTSVHFGFSSKENGMLLSIAHAVSATYLVLTLIAIPRITRGLAGTRYQDSVSASTRYQATKDAFFALLSLSAQAISLILFAAAARSWQIYPISALTALGLAAPSYIKSHFVGFFSPTDGARAVAVMAIMETLGSLLAPVLLGGMQALRPGRDVFLVGATMVMGSAFLFGVGAFMQRFEKIQEVERQEPEPG